MNAKLLKNWAGLLSIVWMVGMFELLGYPPFVFFNALFRLERPDWLWLSADLLVWLGVGVFFAITGLRCGKSIGQICAIVAVGVFIYFAWHFLHPAYVQDAA